MAIKMPGLKYGNIGFFTRSGACNIFPLTAVQVSKKIDYHEARRAECQRYLAGLNSHYGELIAGSSLYFRIKTHDHEFGTYMEVRLYFDAESGLLVRQIRYTEAFLGRNMQQVDYDDYRDVAGVKLPFKWTVTWLDGKDTVELKEVRPNVAIDAARFARPPAPQGP